MHLYRQPIILFGIILPLIVCAAVVGICFTLKSQMVDSFETKVKNSKTATLGIAAARNVEKQVLSQRTQMERWNAQLALETKSLLNKNIREITEHLSKDESKEIALSATEPISGKVGFASVSAQNSSQVRVVFRGTFRTMQRVFLELETRMPQLQLQDLQINPNSSQPSFLNFQVNYTAWEN